ncbi:MAG: hypothetical protein AAGA61_08305 [Pseudomonadota bacterium]
MRYGMLRVVSAVVLLSACTVFVQPGFAQGEDSSTAGRDLMVIGAMLPGIYANANQSYFDERGNRETKHRPLFVRISPADVPAAGDRVLTVSGYYDNDPDVALEPMLWALTEDVASNTVRMRIWKASANSLENPSELDAIAGRDDHCDVFWRREAGQFHATAGTGCDGFAASLQISEAQLWIEYAQQAAGDYTLHRARPFECYADIPGVGGGVDIPYKRYDGFTIHDQGGRFRFTSDEGQDLMIVLWTVDWPINNQVGIFTRDSLVLYVNEFLDDGLKQHAYTFTPPASDRIGINLKWILVNCFMESNRDVTPTM